jgi:hypothetical protein
MTLIFLYVVDDPATSNNCNIICYGKAGNTQNIRKCYVQHRRIYSPTCALWPGIIRPFDAEYPVIGR